MGLRPLESGSQPASSNPVIVENMVNGIDGARAQERGPAGPEQEIGSSRDARHPGDPSTTRQKGRMDKRGDGIRAKSRENLENLRTRNF